MRYVVEWHGNRWILRAASQHRVILYSDDRDMLIALARQVIIKRGVVVDVYREDGNADASLSFQDYSVRAA